MSTVSLDNDWHLTLLGVVRLRRAATDLTPRTRKTRALLAILSTSLTPVPRQRLISLLWSARGEEQARGSLRQALYEIRSLGDTGWLVATGEDVGVERTKLASDLDRLLTHEDPDGIAAAIERCQMPFFGGLDSITPELDDWLRDERARVSNAIVSRARQIAGYRLAANDPAAASRVVDAATRIDPLDEALVRLGFEADAARGHKADLKRRYNRLISDLRETLDVPPSAETETLYRRMAASRPAALTSPSIPAPARRLRYAAWLSGSRFLLFLLLAVVGAALVWRTDSRPRPGAAIAVLPFDDMMIGRPSYFGSGVSEEVLNLLAQQRGLRVLGAMTASEIAAAPDPLARARALGIAYLLDGSVRSNGGRVLFIAHLERTSDGAELWSGRYDRRVEDLFAVQREIAASVAGHFAQAIGIAQPATTSPALYDSYLAARALARQRRPSTLADADQMLAQVIAGDPEYAPAYAERAEVLMLRADHPTSYGALPFAEAREEAEALAKKAVALDPSSGEGYAALGLLTLSDARSLPYYRRAVTLSPQRPEFHRWYGQALLAAHRYKAAINEFERAVAIDPLWELNYEHLLGALDLIGRDAQAKHFAAKFMTLSTDSRDRLALKRLLADIDQRLADRVRFARMIDRAYPDERQSAMSLATALGEIGERTAAAHLARGQDQTAEAVLSADWGELDRIAVGLGSRYWDVASGYWNADMLLVASGHGATLARLYDAAGGRDLPGTPGNGDWNDTAVPALILALRGAGRREDAMRIEHSYAARVASLPRVGALGVAKNRGEAMLAGIDNNATRALALLTAIARRNPRDLALLPAQSLTRFPPFASFANDPRLLAVDERVRSAINDDRASLGLAAIDHAHWIGNSESLLTTN